LAVFTLNFINLESAVTLFEVESVSLSLSPVVKDFFVRPHGAQCMAICNWGNFFYAIWPNKKIS